MTSPEKKLKLSDHRLCLIKKSICDEKIVKLSDLTR